jgi:uncharacterized membrane-anchored protein
MTSAPDSAAVKRRRRRFHCYIRAILAAYPFGAAVGFFVGYNAGSHPTRSTMLVHGLVGLFAGFLVVGVGLHLTAIVFGATVLRTRTHTQGPNAGNDH